MTNRCKSVVLYVSGAARSRAALVGLILVLGMSLFGASDLWAAPFTQGGGGGGGPHKGYTAYTDMCAKCHRAHTADRDNLLIMGGGMGGNSREGAAAMAQDIPEVNLFCYTCHNGTGARLTRPVSTHGNRDFSGRTRAEFLLKCTVCHDPHGSINVFDIKQSLPFGPDNAVGPIAFFGEAGPNSFDDGSSLASARLCVACHEVVGGMKHSGGAGHDGNFDFSGENCMQCHPHSADGLSESADGFMLAADVRELLIARAQVDLQVSQMGFSEPLIAGVPFTYTLTVTNHGPQDAWGVVLTDTLPADVALLAISTPEGALCEGSEVIRCELGDILHEDGITLTLAVLPAPHLYGVLVNQVEVRALQADPAPDDNLTASDDRIVRHADLSISQVSTPAPVQAGSPLTYTLTIVNNGPSVATGVQVQDLLPEVVAIQSSAASQGLCNEKDGVVDCDLGVLKVGNEARVTIRALARTVNATAVNIATVAGDEVDPNAANNRTQSSNEIVWTADLAVMQIAQPSPVETGGLVTYTLTVNNNGPQDAPDVILTDVLPVGSALVSWSASQGQCVSDDEGEDVICELGKLAERAQAQVILLVQAPETSGVMLNRASVGAAPVDLNPDNDFSSLAVSVYDGPDISVSVTPEPLAVVAGQELKYIITVRNLGPSPATDVTLVNTLPAGGTLLYAAATKGPCNEYMGRITCSIGALNVQQHETVTIVVRAPLDDATPLENEVDVTVAEIDPDLSNNQVHTITPVVLQADMVIEMSFFPENVHLNEGLTYTLTVTNIGPSQAVNVEVRDVLPLALRFDTVRTSQGECLEKNGEISCALGEMRQNASVFIVLQVRLVQEEMVVENQAEVWSMIEDPVVGNNVCAVSFTPILTTPTITPTVTPSPTSTPVPTSTPTPTTTTTPTITPIFTSTSTPTPTPAVTPSPSSTPTLTLTPTPSPTLTPTSSATFTPTPTPTSTSAYGGNRFPLVFEGAHVCLRFDFPSIDTGFWAWMVSEVSMQQFQICRCSKPSSQPFPVTTAVAREEEPGGSKKSL